jgi:hypothetical protein
VGEEGIRGAGSSPPAGYRSGFHAERAVLRDGVRSPEQSVRWLAGNGFPSLDAVPMESHGH